MIYYKLHTSHMASSACKYPTFATHMRQYNPGLVAKTFQAMTTNGEFVVLDTKKVNIAIIMNKTVGPKGLRMFSLKCD